MKSINQPNVRSSVNSLRIKPKKHSVDKITEKNPKLRNKFNDKYIEMIKFLYEGSIQGISPCSWLPAVPSMLLGQLETHQASRLLPWALTLAMKFLMKGHVFSNAAWEAETGGSLEMKLILGSAQLLTGNLLCTESLHEVPIGHSAAIGSASGHLHVARHP